MLAQQIDNDQEMFEEAEMADLLLSMANENKRCMLFGQAPEGFVKTSKG